MAGVKTDTLNGKSNGDGRPNEFGMHDWLTAGQSPPETVRLHINTS